MCANPAQTKTAPYPVSDGLVKRLSSTKMFNQILVNAGIKRWPKLFNNLRARAITDAVEFLPSHVVNSWFGNDEGISREFYRQTTEEHYRKAIERESALKSVSQFEAQQPSKRGALRGNNENPDCEASSKMQEKPQEQHAAEQDRTDEWAMGTILRKHGRIGKHGP